MEPTQSAKPPHIPVLLDRCLELLRPAAERPGAVIVDATLGAGGHSAGLLREFSNATVVGIDRDLAALDLARSNIANESEALASRFRAVHAVYDELPEVLESYGIESVDAILFDLGVSSMQLDQTERGFAYSHDAPLDMRMNQDDSVKAADLLATSSERELARILRTFGQEKFATNIARAVVKQREHKPLTTSSELVDLIKSSIPAAARRTGGNPAKRTFQALRIAVNGELEVLKRAIPMAVEALNVGGRLVVLSYQSLEDRIVKQAFAQGLQSTAPKGMPVVRSSDEPYLRSLTRGSEQANESEVAENPRSKPVRLRAIERVALTPEHRKFAHEASKNPPNSLSYGGDK